MNKKAIVYFAAAVTLGFTIMMLPTAMRIPLTPLGGNNTSEGTRGNEATDGNYLSPLSGKDGPPTLGLATQPYNLLPSSGILLTGLIVAATVYLIAKKRLG